MFNTRVDDNQGPFRISLTAHALMGRKGASEYGGHVILPDSVLQSLLARDIQYPMLFKLQVEETKKSVYCGVTEFTAPQNVIYLPQWMMDQLGIVEGQQVQLFNVMLQLGTYLLIRPHTYKFVEKYSDPKTILEQHITKYATLTRGTTIKICVDGEVWSFDIVELKPSRAVCILNTDLKLDFDEPLDIKEYEAKVKSELEQRRLQSQFAQTATTFQQVSPSATYHADSPYDSHFPNYNASTPNDNSDDHESSNIFADSDNENSSGPSLDQKFGSGNSIKKNVVSHPATNTVPQRSKSVNPIFAPIPRTVHTAAEVTTTNPQKSSIIEDENKKKRQELIRLQRAALYGKKPTPVTKSTATTTSPHTTPLNHEQREILGIDKEVQGVFALNTDKSDDVTIKTIQDGDWQVQVDANGRLIKREEVKKSFAMSGVGNSIKRD